MKPTLDLYVKQLVSEGSFTEGEIKSMQDRIWNMLEEKYKQSKDYTPSNTDWVSSTWEGELASRFLLCNQVCGKHCSEIPYLIPSRFYFRLQVTSRVGCSHRSTTFHWYRARAIAKHWYCSLLISKRLHCSSKLGSNLTRPRKESQRWRRY